MTNIEEERARFEAAMHRMRDIFNEMQSTVKMAVPGASTQVWNDLFFEGYQRATMEFNDIATYLDILAEK
jgi:hypothetical protein